MSLSDAKAAELLQSIVEDAERKRRSSRLEDLLRNNIEEKVIVSPGLRKPEVGAVRGRGGKAVSLFEGMRVV